MRHLIADFDAGQKSASGDIIKRSPTSPFVDNFRLAEQSSTMIGFVGGEVSPAKLLR